jgi:hypothetical protein
VPDADETSRAASQSSQLHDRRIVQDLHRAPLTAIGSPATRL